VFTVNKDNYLRLEQVYLGLNAKSRLSDLMSDPQFAESSEKIKSMTRDCYKVAAAQIQKKFWFQGEIYESVELVNSSFAVLGKVRILQPFFTSFELRKEQSNH